MAIPPLFLAGVGVGGLGLLLQIVGLATKEWMTLPGRELGLFKGCVLNLCGDINGNSDYEAVRAMEVIGCLAGCAGVGLAVLFLILQVLGKSTMKIFTILAAGACIAACFFIILGVIIYGATIYDDASQVADLGYSFALAIVGGILLGVAGALIFIGGKSFS